MNHLRKGEHITVGLVFPECKMMRGMCTAVKLIVPIKGILAAEMIDAEST